jgi:hypothetical protein
MPIAPPHPQITIQIHISIIIQNLELFFSQPNNMSNPSNKKAEN